MPASGPAWADCLPGRAASCWGRLCWRCFSTGLSASGCARWGPFTGCATGFPSTACRWTQAGAPPAGRAAVRARWMWMCSGRPTMPRASAAGTVRPPAPMGPSPGYFQSKQCKRRRRLPHETRSDPIAVGGADDRRIDRLQLRRRGRSGVQDAFSGIFRGGHRGR